MVDYLEKNEKIKKWICVKKFESVETRRFDDFLGAEMKQRYFFCSSPSHLARTIPVGHFFEF
jgi:hypothetical protein